VINKTDRVVVEILPHAEAGDDDLLSIESELEALIGGPWDESDEVDGRIVYRHGLPSEELARQFIADFQRLGLKAVVRLLP
jgi:hypothetical protein